MLRSGNSVRFTDKEVKELREIGFNFEHVKDAAGIEHEVTRWVDRLADERFDLLDKIAREMAKETGKPLPPPLSVVRDADSSEQS